jgi:hypothetical protein
MSNVPAAATNSALLPATTTTATTAASAAMTTAVPSLLSAVTPTFPTMAPQAPQQHPFCFVPCPVHASFQQPPPRSPHRVPPLTV